MEIRLVLTRPAKQPAVCATTAQPKAFPLQTWSATIEALFMHSKSSSLRWACAYGSVAVQTQSHVRASETSFAKHRHGLGPLESGTGAAAEPASTLATRYLEYTFIH
jgi:hypothetical protein